MPFQGICAADTAYAKGCTLGLLRDLSSPVTISEMLARAKLIASVLAVGVSVAVIAAASVPAAAPSASAQARQISASAVHSGKIQAHLSKASFSPAGASTAKLLYNFSPASSSFGFKLLLKSGAQWQIVRNVTRTGHFVGSHTTTVKALFGAKPVKAGSYRLELSADANRIALSFRVAVAFSVTATRANRPGKAVKLIFVHHSTGENWLSDDNGELGLALKNNNYFVSDTNYGWGPDGIGDRTDIGDWWLWFRGPSSSTYLAALYREFNQHASYSRRTDPDPGHENEVIMFKSCFPNSQISGPPGDAPTTGSNPLRGQGAGSEYMTVANVKGIYNDLLTYFAAHQDKLFVLVVSPPLAKTETDAAHAANARAIAKWLVNDWLTGYQFNNVAVFDFFNVLTSNGGNANSNDLGRAGGNHHRWWGGRVQHIQTSSNNFSAYPTGDSHPSRAGNLKATGEFVDLLNYYYQRWGAGGSS